MLSSDTQKQRRHDSLVHFSEENIEMDVSKTRFSNTNLVLIGCQGSNLDDTEPKSPRPQIPETPVFWILSPQKFCAMIVHNICLVLSALGATKDPNVWNFRIHS